MLAICQGCALSDSEEVPLGYDPVYEGEAKQLGVLEFR